MGTVWRCDEILKGPQATRRERTACFMLLFREPTLVPNGAYTQWDSRMYLDKSGLNPSGQILNIYDIVFISHTKWRPQKDNKLFKKVVQKDMVIEKYIPVIPSELNPVRSAKLLYHV